MSGFKGFGDEKHWREDAPLPLVFNPKTSNALEGDNRKSIRTIKNVRKPVPLRQTSCIINLSLSLSLSFSAISFDLLQDRVSRHRPRYLKEVWRETNSFDRRVIGSRSNAWTKVGRYKEANKSLQNL